LNTTQEYSVSLSGCLVRVPVSSSLPLLATTPFVDLVMWPPAQYGMYLRIGAHIGALIAYVDVIRPFLVCGYTHQMGILNHFFQSLSNLYVRKENI
jgi:hypothetical protein